MKKCLVLLVLPLLAWPVLAKVSFGDAKAARNLVEVSRLDPSLRLDVRYATSQNFMGRVLYPQARVFLIRPAAQAVVRVQKKLRAQNLGLVLFDGYRPWSITQQMWDQTPPGKKQYVADPAKGSRHNRGCAADLTLQNLTSGEALEMPTEYDDFTDKAHAEAVANPTATHNRALLRQAMESEGFRIYPYEWWHYDYQGWEKFPLLNFSFVELDGLFKRLEK